MSAHEFPARPIQPQPGRQPSSRRPDPAAPDLADPADITEQQREFLAGAARSLRTHDDPRWVEVSSRILTSALRATRRSQPIRARAPGGRVFVSEQVIVAYLREALDGRIPGTAVAGLHLDIAGRDTCTGVLIELIVQYKTTILPATDLIHARAGAVLEELLGPTGHQISVRTSHVHISDVTLNDPQTENPAR